MSLTHIRPIFYEPLQVERVNIHLKNLSPSLKGIKLIQLSDFHCDGVHLSQNILDDVIQITRQENPDLIILTGDYITYRPQPIYPLIQSLKLLKSRLGTYAILGNHDLYHPLGKQIVTEALNSINITVLWNAIAMPLGEELPIIGLADYWSKAFNPEPLLSSIDPQIPRLVLSHNPDSAEILQQWRVDLQLSGHTHGGQIVIPGIGAVPMIIDQLRPYVPKFLHPYIPLWRECAYVIKKWQWSQGLHSVGDNFLYVNRGLGSYFPGRLFCPPELTLITLI